MEKLCIFSMADFRMSRSKQKFKHAARKRTGLLYRLQLLNSNSTIYKLLEKKWVFLSALYDA